jgi:hypothetical protein
MKKLRHCKWSIVWAIVIACRAQVSPGVSNDPIPPGSVFDGLFPRFQHQGNPVTGTVFGLSGARAPGVLMGIIPDSGDAAFQSDSNGRYAFYMQELVLLIPKTSQHAFHMDPGCYLVGRDPQHNLASLVQIHEGDTNLDLHLQPGLTITGSVVDDKGVGLKTATVQLACYTTSILGTAFFPKLMTMDNHGAFSINALLPGHPYYFIIKAPGYSELDKVMEANETQTATLAVPPFQLSTR